MSPKALNDNNRFPFADLPYHIMVEIASFLPRSPNSFADFLLALSLTSKAMFELFSPLLFRSICVEKDYDSFQQQLDGNLKFSTLMRTQTRKFRATIHYDKDKTMQLPSFDKLSELRLKFFPPFPIVQGCVRNCRPPKSANLLFSAMDSFVCKYGKLTSLSLHGILFCDNVVEALTKLSYTAQNLHTIELNFQKLHFFDLPSEDTKLAVTDGNARRFANSLSNLRRLHTFAIRNLDSEITFMTQVQVDDFMSTLISGLESVKTLRSFAIASTLNESYRTFERFLAQSRLLDLKIESISVTDELAVVIKKLSTLKSLHLEHLSCTKSLFSCSPTPLSPYLQHFTLNGLTIFASEGNEAIDLSNAVSFQMKDYLYCSNEYLNFKTILIESLINSSALCDFECIVKMKEHFVIAVEVLRTCRNLKTFSIYNDTYESNRLRRSSNLIEQEWFGELQEELYDTLELSSIKTLQISIQIVSENRLRRLLEISESLQNVVVMTPNTQQIIVDFSGFCQSVDKNQKSRFASLIIKVRDLSRFVEQLKLYHHGGKWKIKLVAKAAAQEHLRIYYEKVLKTVVRRWQENEKDGVDRVILDALRVEDLKHFRNLEVSYRDGEICISRG